MFLLAAGAASGATSDPSQRIQSAAKNMAVQLEEDVELQSIPTALEGGDGMREYIGGLLDDSSHENLFGKTVRLINSVETGMKLSSLYTIWAGAGDKYSSELADRIIDMQVELYSSLRPIEVPEEALREFKEAGLHRTALDEFKTAEGLTGGSEESFFAKVKTMIMAARAWIWKHRISIGLFIMLLMVVAMHYYYGTPENQTGSLWEGFINPFIQKISLVKESFFGEAEPGPSSTFPYPQGPQPAPHFDEERNPDSGKLFNLNPGTYRGAEDYTNPGTLHRPAHVGELEGKQYDGRRSYGSDPNTDRTLRTKDYRYVWTDPVPGPANFAEVPEVSDEVWQQKLLLNPLDQHPPNTWESWTETLGNLLGELFCKTYLLNSCEWFNKHFDIARAGTGLLRLYQCGKLGWGVTGMGTLLGPIGAVIGGVVTGIGCMAYRDATDTVLWDAAQYSSMAGVAAITSLAVFAAAWLAKIALSSNWAEALTPEKYRDSLKGLRTFLEHTSKLHVILALGFTASGLGASAVGIYTNQLTDFFETLLGFEDKMHNVFAGVFTGLVALFGVILSLSQASGANKWVVEGLTNFGKVIDRPDLFSIKATPRAHQKQKQAHQKQAPDGGVPGAEEWRWADDDTDLAKVVAKVKAVEDKMQEQRTEINAATALLDYKLAQLERNGKIAGGQENGHLFGHLFGQVFEKVEAILNYLEANIGSSHPDIIKILRDLQSKAKEMNDAAIREQELTWKGSVSQAPDDSVITLNVSYSTINATSQSAGLSSPLTNDLPEGLVVSQGGQTASSHYPMIGRLSFAVAAGADTLSVRVEDKGDIDAAEGSELWQMGVGSQYGLQPGTLHAATWNKSWDDKRGAIWVNILNGHTITEGHRIARLSWCGKCDNSKSPMNWMSGYRGWQRVWDYDSQRPMWSNERGELQSRAQRDWVGSGITRGNAWTEIEHDGDYDGWTKVWLFDRPLYMHNVDNTNLQTRYQRFWMGQQEKVDREKEQWSLGKLFQSMPSLFSKPIGKPDEWEERAEMRRILAMQHHDGSLSETVPADIQMRLNRTTVWKNTVSNELLRNNPYEGLF